VWGTANTAALAPLSRDPTPTPIPIPNPDPEPQSPSRTPGIAVDTLKVAEKLTPLLTKELL